MRYTISSAVASILLPATLAPGHALAEVPQVVTDIPPVHALVAGVMGDLGQPVLLLAPGADEHDFALKPSQMGAVAGAGLAVWIDPDLTPWMARALEGSDAVTLGLLDAPGTVTRAFAGEGHDEEGHDEGHDHSGTDPHAWLNPGNAVVWTGLIAAELARLDPEHAATYAANAQSQTARLQALDAALAAQLAPVAGRPFVTFHDAYGYFADHYGLSYRGALALGDAADPGAAHVARMRAGMADVACVFPEAQHDPALLQTLTEGSAARTGGALDPVGSTLTPGPEAYAALMAGLASTLTACLAP